MRGAFFEPVRSEVVSWLEREKMPEAYAHYQEAIKREEREKAMQSMDGKAGGTFDGMSTTSSSTWMLGTHSTAGSSSMSKSVADLVLPLKVEVGAEQGSDVLELRVKLLAAGTQLEWTVERAWKDFVALHKGLKRYNAPLAALPSKLITTDRKRLQQWLDSITRSSVLSATKEVYNFLSIGKTVELLSGAANRARPETRPVQHKEVVVAEDVGSANLDESLVLADPDALNRALEHLEYLVDDSDGSEVGSLRARKKGNDEERVSAQDIEQALQHLMRLQFTVTPSRAQDEAEEAGDLGSDGDDDDQEEDETDATHNESRDFDPKTAKRDTAEFDLKTVVAEQKATIDRQNATITQLQARIKELESQLMAAQKNARK